VETLRYVVFVHEIWTIPKIQVEMGKLYPISENNWFIDEQGDFVHPEGHPLCIVFISDELPLHMGTSTILSQW